MVDVKGEGYGIKMVVLGLLAHGCSLAREWALARSWLRELEPL